MEEIAITLISVHEPIDLKNSNEITQIPTNKATPSPYETYKAP